MIGVKARLTRETDASIAGEPKTKAELANKYGYDSQLYKRWVVLEGRAVNSGAAFGSILALTLVYSIIFASIASTSTGASDLHDVAVKFGEIGGSASGVSLLVFAICRYQLHQFRNREIDSNDREIIHHEESIHKAAAQEKLKDLKDPDGKDTAKKSLTDNGKDDTKKSLTEFAAEMGEHSVSADDLRTRKKSVKQSLIFIASMIGLAIIASIIIGCKLDGDSRQLALQVTWSTGLGLSAIAGIYAAVQYGQTQWKYSTEDWIKVEKLRIVKLKCFIAKVDSVGQHYQSTRFLGDDTGT